MSLLALSGFVLFSALASASQRHINFRDVCSSSPLRRHSLEARDSFTQVPLGPAPATPSLPSPWNSEVECVTVEVEDATESYCVYSSHAFADGRGISVLTTPDRAEYIARLPAFTKAGALFGVNAEPSPPYEERELPGRGRGLIANKTLHRGDRIFAYTPILMLDEEAYEDLAEEDWQRLEKMAVNALPPGAHKKFWELFGWPKMKDPVSDRVGTNAFGVTMDESMEYFGIFPEIAVSVPLYHGIEFEKGSEQYPNREQRLNHDCRPNAAYFTDPETLVHYVHAVTTITPGTEITITYIDPLEHRRKRLDALSSFWGFNCSCSLCSMHPSLTNASDSRLRQVAKIHEEETAPLYAAEALISLYEQERLHIHKADAYQFAALAACAEGQRWKTIQYARLAVELGMLHNGFRDEDVEEMMRLEEQPEKESCWLEREGIVSAAAGDVKSGDSIIP